MKRALMFALIVSVLASADELKDRQLTRVEVVHVATSLDHLTVLEFGEPVTMAAAGSPAFQIERHEDKVFIKPLKSSAATDLFVWTASRRFTYELEPPGEAKDMNFAVDNPAPAPKPVKESRAQMDEIADMMLTRAFLGIEPINNTYIKDTKGRVSVRVERVFRSQSTLYIQYSIHNLTDRPYRIVALGVSELTALRPSISIDSLTHTQVNQQALKKLGELKQRSVTVAHAEAQQADLQPGEESQGIVAIREQVRTTTVLQLTFGPEGKHPVEAVLVF
ncbi:MAG: TrbG/VirB9 family P-type conjugative transfer protein [Candidatus Angelobacter sp.]